jgi:hypothetical protein
VDRRFVTVTSVGLKGEKARVAYGNQTEKDWNGFLAAIKAGRIVAAGACT